MALSLGIIASLLCSALFSGIEIAYVSANKLHLELLSKKGGLYGPVFRYLLNSPRWFIASTLVGNTVALTLYGIYMGQALDPQIVALLPDQLQSDILVLLVQTIVSTMVVLLVGEFLPKSLFMSRAESLLEIFAIPLLGLYMLIYPFVAAVLALSKFVIINVLKQNFPNSQVVFGITDLEHFINQNIGNEAEEESEVDARILNNAVEFKTTKVRECMVPRTDIVAIDLEDSIEELRKAFIRSGHSKIMVYRENIDDIIGYCHSSALFKKPQAIGDILSPITIVPETMLARNLLMQFINEHRSIALVVDEFGGTSGIVSMEDVMEEIFGEIHDEHDASQLLEEKLGEGQYRFSARHEVVYLNKAYGFGIPDGDYDTLGGFILALNEDIPEEGDILTYDNLTFKVEKKEEHRLDTITLFVNYEKEEAN